jgi:hypothetical protein
MKGVWLSGRALAKHAQSHRFNPQPWKTMKKEKNKERKQKKRRKGKG